MERSDSKISRARTDGSRRTHLFKIKICAFSDGRLYVEPKDVSVLILIVPSAAQLIILLFSFIAHSCCPSTSGEEYASA